MQLLTLSALRAGGPDGFMIGSVDHHIPIILYLQVRTIVTICIGGPDGFMIGSVDHQVAIRLHGTLAYLPTIRIGGPNGGGARICGLVEDEITVLLHDQLK